MAVRRIEVKNFKSFRDLKLDLKDFNVLIGANASGKSNFVDIFKFLKDISVHGLDNAISMRGVEYVRNMKRGNDKELSVGIVLDTSEIMFLTDGSSIKMRDINYSFTLEFGAGKKGYRVASERVELKAEYYRGDKMEGEAEIKVIRDDGRVDVDMTKKGDMPFEEDDLKPPFPTISENTLIIRSPIFIAPILLTEFQQIGIYDFDPKLPKSAIPITGMAELEEDGENLPIILKKILEDPESKRKLYNLIRDVLPFVEDLDVERFTDSSLLFKLKESYYPDQYLPAPLISDGTVNVTALLTALYFEGKRTVIIEEPERNIHPYLIEKVVNLMEEASEKKQVIITTHNPEVVKYAGLEPLLLVSRNRDGFSTVRRAVEREEIGVFLRNNIGLEELYVQNLLEG
ncbi:MAG: ATPase [Thermoplasmata archaeon]|nr:MAG: ATPase [Thermoplasmata archaeon]